MHIGMKGRVPKKQGGTVELEAGLGLTPQKSLAVPALTRQDLLDGGIPFWRVDPILAQLARWVQRNPDKNQKELLLALAKGYNRLL